MRTPHTRRLLPTLALVLSATAAAQGDLLGALKAQAGNLAMPALGGNTVGNAAGVLQYCVKNNLLGGDAAGLKDKLMGKVTGQPAQETGFQAGLGGLLQGGDGRSLNLQSLSGTVKEKACDYVLKNASSLL